MKKIKIKTIGTREIPESWEEVTVHHYLKFTFDWDGKDPIRLLSFLINEDYAKVFESGEDPAKIEKVLSYMLLSSMPDWNQLKRKIPETIEIQGNTLQVRSSTCLC